MKFGIALQWGDFRHMGLLPTLSRVARMARELGYQSLWTTDQMAARSSPAFSTEPLVTVASLIHVVPEMQLGVAVLVLPQRNAAVVAKQAATLSLLSEGRFALGVGVGWNEHEYKLLNADFKNRGRHMDESLAVMQRLWQADNVTFRGDFYRFEDVTMSPRPNGGHVPLWLGGNGKAAIRRAAQFGDAWIPAAISPAELEDGVQQLRNLSSGGAKPTVAAMLMVRACVSDDREDEPFAHVGGSIETMIAQLQSYQEAGLEHLICTFTATNMNDLVSQMQVFADDIMPHFPE